MQKTDKDAPNFLIDRRKVLGALGVMACGLLPDKALSAPINTIDQNEQVNILYFPSLIDAMKSADIKAGSVIGTLGYHKLGDGGSARYSIIKDSADLKSNGGDIVKFKGGWTGILIDVQWVNYKVFGALGDSVSDDGVQIKNAHDFANRNELPVINLNGEYWIEKTRRIEVKTSVQWGHSVFHIKEAYNTKAAVFNVMGYDQPVKISLNDSQKNNVVKSIKPGTQIIPELKEYKNHLILIKDEDDRIGFRSGEKYKGQSRAKEELFYVEEDGKILGDIAWTFNGYTDLTAYPAEKSYLTIEGGTFYLSGDNPGKTKIGYFQNGFSITRSRTLIKNQWVGLEDGKRDIAYNPRNGFYNFNCVYDTLLENIRLIPWEQDRPGKDNDVFAGTYGIGGNRMLNTTFRNITAEGTLLHWGVFGTNMNKNFRIENCRLNRVDVHFHCWNLTIKDSQIGNRGISITGGGDLVIENTQCENPRFVNFRRDFGGKWDGNISITNCKLKPSHSTETSILYFIAGNFDYRYPIGLARTIHVENFTVDYSNASDCDEKCWLIKASDFSVSDKGERLFFPKSIIFKNVFVEGRDKGVRIMELPDPQSYFISSSGSYDGSFIDYNSFIHFDSIQLEKIKKEEDNPNHLKINFNSMGNGYDRNSLYPKIQISNCNAFAGDFGEMVAGVLFENSSVNRVSVGSENKMPGELSFYNCKFLPFLLDSNEKPYHLSTKLGTTFLNCVFLAPREDDEIGYASLSLLDFMVVNKSVLYNHINSRLGNDVLKYYKSKGIKLSQEFIAMLKNHSDLED